MYQILIKKLHIQITLNFNASRISKNSFSTFIGAIYPLETYFEK